MRIQKTHNSLHVSALLDCHHPEVTVPVKIMSFEMVRNLRHCQSLKHLFTKTLTQKHSHSLKQPRSNTATQ